MTRRPLIAPSGAYASTAYRTHAFVVVFVARCALSAVPSRPPAASRHSIATYACAPLSGFVVKLRKYALAVYRPPAATGNSCQIPDVPFIIRQLVPSIGDVLLTVILLPHVHHPTRFALSSNPLFRRVSIIARISELFVARTSSLYFHTYGSIRYLLVSAPMVFVNVTVICTAFDPM